MSQTQKIAPFFSVSAGLPDWGRNIKQLDTVPHFLNNALGNPSQAEEFELSIACVFHNNSIKDIKDDAVWESMGVENGHAGAVEKIKKAYLKAVPLALAHHAKNAKYNPQDYDPSQLIKQNPISGIIADLRRAHRDHKDGESYLLTNEAWQEAGIETIQDFQEQVREIFLKIGTGGRIADQRKEKFTTPEQLKDWSIRAADNAIRHAFPELADKLGIPQDIGRGLVREPLAAAVPFGQSHDLIRR